MEIAVAGSLQDYRSNTREAARSVSHAHGVSV
jgi:hypothetical protein